MAKPLGGQGLGEVTRCGEDEVSVKIDESWTARAACAGREPDDLFVQGAAQRQAREVCFSCPVRLECLVDALDNKIEFGVWGGMTERERRALLRRAPAVDSWAKMLADMDAKAIAELISQRWPTARPAARSVAS